MATTAATFRVALIQMRSGRSPAANLDVATRLIGEAKAGGADYVQTPEMTNILEARRDALMAAIVPEHDDPSLAAFRDLGSFFKHAAQDDAGTPNPVAGGVSWAITRGVSQSGNYLRQFLHLGSLKIGSHM